MPERDREQRFPTTVLFTDIADSTQRAAGLGDEAWGEILRSHHATVRRELRAHGGREIDNAGDGFFASFTSPAAAIRCACAIVDAVRPLGIEIRAGVHVGESVRVGDKPGGMAVHIGARIAGHAGQSEVVVSGTVRDLTAGSGISFEDRGLRELKGVEGEWRIYAVIRTGDLAPRDLHPERPREPRVRRWWVAAAAAALVMAVVAALLIPRGSPPAPAASPQGSPGDPTSALYRVDIAAQRITSRNTERVTTDIAVARGFLWVAERRALGKWSLTREEYVDHLPLDAASDVTEPLLMVAARGDLFVAAVGPQFLAFLVYRVDLSPTGEVISSQPVSVPGLPIALAAGRDALWATLAVGELVQIPYTGGRARLVPFDGAPVAIAASGGRMYVADSAGRVVAIDEGTGRSVGEQDIGEPTAIAVGHGSVWVTSDEFGTGGDEGASTLLRLDPRTLAIQASIPMPNSPEDIAVTEAGVWVGCTSGTLVLVDPAGNERVGTPISLQGGIRQLFLAATAEDVFVSIFGGA